MDSINTAISNTVTTLAAQRHITRKELAKAIHNSPSFIGMLLRGTTKRGWTIREVSEISELFGFDNIIDFFRIVEETTQFTNAANLMTTHNDKKDKEDEE